MPRTRIAAFALISIAALTAGCGGSGKPAGTVAQPAAAASAQTAKSASGSGNDTFAAEANLICRRVIARRSRIRVAKLRDYARELPPLGEYEREAAAQMRTLKPPTGDVGDWQRVVMNMKEIADAMVLAGEDARYDRLTAARGMTAPLENARKQLDNAAAEAGLQECERIS